MMRYFSVLLAHVLIVFPFSEIVWADRVEFKQPVFVSGDAGYHTYRIPALVVTGQGTLVAFCEGRRSGQGDAGDIDLLVKRSHDQGKTWSEPSVVWDDGVNSCGNPCPIFDAQTDTLWLLMTWNHGADREAKIINGTSRDTRKVYVTSSQDDGRTWARPHEITTDVKKSSWTWYATGPGAGIVIEQGPHAGRLVAPCDHIEAETKDYYSHIIFSDDHGATWHLGGRTPRPAVNECQVAEISGNRLLLNMRSYHRAKKCRQTAVSADGGATWQDQRQAELLIDPICQASLRGYGWTPDGTRRLLLFSNPASASRREKLTLRTSFDEGTSWPEAEVLHAGPAAYSDLVVLSQSAIGCLFEAGEKSPYERITFALIDISSED